MRAKKIAYYKDANFAKRLLPPPDVPNLKIVDHMIPEFDIPKESSSQKQEPDPNQLDIYKNDPLKPKQSANMSDALRDEILDFHRKQGEGEEDTETDAIIDVLRSAFK